jgi:hypothetical protein
MMLRKMTLPSTRFQRLWRLSGFIERLLDDGWLD